MIKMTILSGPYAGKTRIVPPGINAQDIIGDCLHKGWEWKIDYTQATQIEAVEWFKHDLSCRVIRALAKGLPVTFVRKVYVIKNPDDTQELKQLAGEIEDAIVRSGHMVSIERDDENGVVVSTHGFEH